MTAVGALVTFGCTMATPYPREIDDEIIVEDEDADTRTPSEELEPCTLEGTEALGINDFVIQIRSPQCSNAVCLHYQLETFCTHRCVDDADCADVIDGVCDFEVNLGDPDIIGRYCVPE